MDRQTAAELADEHDQKASAARFERRYWEALYENALAFHYSNVGIPLPHDGGAIQAMMRFGHDELMLRLPPEKRKPMNAEIVAWSRDSGDEAELSAILEKYKE